MRAYQRVLDEIEEAGATLVAVSPEKPDATLSTADKNELRFEVLSDRGNDVAREYGLVFRLDDELVGIYTELGIVLPERHGVDAWELPVPATFVIGEDGVVRLASVDVDYTRRLEPEVILRALRRS